MTGDKVLCHNCQTKMGKSGFAWSGTKKLQRYKCHSCGTTTTRTNDFIEVKRFKVPFSLDQIHHLQLQLRASKAKQTLQEYIFNQLFREH